MEQNVFMRLHCKSVAIALSIHASIKTLQLMRFA